MSILDIDKKEFAEIRIHLKLSPPELASLLGVSRSTVNRWENGERAIPRLVSLVMRAADKKPDILQTLYKLAN